MDTDPVSVLNQLLLKTPVEDAYRIGDEVTFTLAVSEDFFTGDRRDAHSRVEAEFVNHFERIVEQVVREWGNPTFTEYPLAARSEFDEDSTSLEAELYWRGVLALAYWERAAKTAFICVEHQDTELPYCLQLGVKDGG